MTLHESLQRIQAPANIFEILNYLEKRLGDNLLPKFKESIDNVLERVKRNEWNLPPQVIVETISVNQCYRQLVDAAELVGMNNLPDVSFSVDAEKVSSDTFIMECIRYSNEVYNLALNSLTPNNQ